MKNEKVIKNLGNIGLLVFSAGIWIDVIFDMEPEGWYFSIPAIALVALGLVTVAAHFVIRARARKAEKAKKEEER
ncbi:MAG: hypothetical protein LBC21_00245 [Oscillospiraceae bacterium]|jgi:hypothetical protein|nr:hypothetical protein [Oscillospiraceae bacterium]